MSKYVYKNTDGSYSTARVMQFVAADGTTQEVSAANPLPAAAPGGGSAVSIADGADVTQGAKADAAATDSTSSWSAIAMLKGIYSRLATGEAVSIADGSDVSQGAKADAAYAGSGSASIVSILKGLYTSLVGATPAGTNVIGHVIADTGSTTAVTGNITVVQATGTSLHAVLDTTSTTAVTQATAANLNATVVGTGTLAVQNTAATPTGTNVIGHVIADTGSTTAVTGNVTVVQGTAANLKVDPSGVTSPVSAASLPLPSGASTSALQPTNSAQAATTSGQTGHLGMGAVTTVAPSYTTAQTNPLSLTTAGALRTDSSAVTQPISAASNVPVSQATAASLNATVVGAGSSSAASGGSLSVNPDSVVDGTTTTATVSSATTILTFTTAGYGYIAFGFSAVGGGATVVVDTAPDGVTYNGTAVFYRTDIVTNSAAANQTTPTIAMQFVVPVSAQNMRIRLSAYTSGSYTLYATMKRGAYVPSSTIVSPITPADGSSNGTQSVSTYSKGAVYNGTTWDRAVEVVNATNSTGTGIQAIANLAQFDDASPTAITENQFGNVRMSANRNQYTTIRDAAGNERGANVTATNQLAVAVTGNTGAIVDNVIGAATAAANMVQVGGVFTTGGVTLTTGQSGAVQLDSHASQKVSLYDGNGTVIDPTLASQIYFSNSYNNINTKTTTTVKSGAGRVQGIQVNTLGTADTLTVYDNTAGSGTKIATITSPLLGSNFCVGAAFGTGLTIVTAGTTAGDYTVYYT